MPIDPSIALNIRPVQLANPLEQFGQFQQARAAMSQNRLADLILGDKQREASETAQLNRLYKGATGADGKLDRNMLLGSVAAEGLGARIPGLQKDFQALDAGQADIAKTQADTAKAQAEASAKKLDLAGQAFGYVRANPTLENAHQVLDYLGANGVYTPETVAQYKQAVAADPTKIASLADTAFRTVLDAKDQLMKVDTRNLGGTTQTIGTDPLTGQTKVLNTAVNSQSPDNKATVAASRDNAAATREVAAATRDAARIQRDQATEMKLADDYRAQSKVFKETSDAYKQLNATLDKATTSPAATLAAATKFMKLLDPGSVVRESELGMALAATGVLDRATSYVETLKHGKVLTPAQVKDFKNITQQIYAAAQDGQRAIDANYRNQAKTYGLRPEVIVQDLGQNSQPGAASAPAASTPDIEALLQKYGQ